MVPPSDTSSCIHKTNASLRKPQLTRADDLAAGPCMIVHMHNCCSVYPQQGKALLCPTYRVLFACPVVQHSQCARASPRRWTHILICSCFLPKQCGLLAVCRQVLRKHSQAPNGTGERHCRQPFVITAQAADLSALLRRVCRQEACGPNRQKQSYMGHKAFNYE
jgi:hypothetical protein